MLDKLTCSDFEKHLNQDFKVVSDDVDMTLRLVEAKVMGQGNREGGSFSLLFAGPAEPVLEQAVIPLEHAELGKLELFLVPVGPGFGDIDYEAVFT